MIFDEKYFYRLLSAINSSVDFIVNSTDSRYNIDSKTFMQSSKINILIGALSAINNVDFIINSIDFRYNIEFRDIYFYRRLSTINSNVKVQDKCFYRRLYVYHLFLKKK